jgi:hypothetical protein
MFDQTCSGQEHILQHTHHRQELHLPPTSLPILQTHPKLNNARRRYLRRQLPQRQRPRQMARRRRPRHLSTSTEVRRSHGPYDAKEAADRVGKIQAGLRDLHKEVLEALKMAEVWKGDAAEVGCGGWEGYEGDICQ